MKHITLIVGASAAFALLFAMSARAMPAGDQGGLHSQHKQGQSQEALERDSDSNFQAADRELNQVYSQVLRKYAKDPVFIAKLKAAQRAWLAFREAEVAAHYPDANPTAAYGSVYPACVDDLETELTMKRIEELKLWRDGTQEGDVCAGSVHINGDAD